MKISIQVKLNKTKTGVEKLNDGSFVVYTKQPAKENKANLDVIKQLAEHFKVPKTSVVVIKGLTSRTKIIDIK